MYDSIECGGCFCLQGQCERADYERWMEYWDSLTAAEKASEEEAMALYAAEADY